MSGFVLGAKDAMMYKTDKLSAFKKLMLQM